LQKQPPAAPPPPTVEVVEVKEQDVPIYHEWMARWMGW